jgi:hypothetical protein
LRKKVEARQMAERDPRTEPMVGDVLSKRLLRRYDAEPYSAIRKIVDVDAKQWLSVLYEDWRDDESLGLERCSPHQWQTWARDAQIVTVAKEGT